MEKKELEAIGCRTFACPNLSSIDEKGKELRLKDATIKKAKDMAIEYLKKTYHNPRYSSITYLLPSFLYIASTTEGDKISKERLREAFMTNDVTMRKWNKDIIDILGLETDLTTYKHRNYVEAVRPNVAWLKEQIAASRGITIMVRLSDFAAECGIEMKKIVDGEVVEKTSGSSPDSVIQGLKYALFHEGIAFKIRTLKDGQPAMVMWLKTEHDKLPKSILPSRKTDSVLMQTNLAESPEDPENNGYSYR